MAKFLIPSICLASCLAASAATTRTYNQVSGAWETAANWSSSNIPDTTGERAELNGASITLGQDYTISSLRAVNVGAATLTGSGGARTLTVSGTLGTGDDSRVYQSLTLDNVTVSGSGDMQITGASLAFANSGQLRVTGGTTTFGSPGLGNVAVGVSGSGTIRLTGGTLGVIESGSAVTLGSGTALSLEGGSLSVAAGTTLNLGSGSTTTLGGASLANAGAITSGGTLALGSVSTTSSGAGSLSISGGSVTLDLVSLGTYGKLTSGGSIALSGSPSLAVSSSTTFGLGDTFTILSGASRTGTFADATVTASGSGQLFNISYSGTDVTLTAVPEPQYYAGAVALGLLGFTAWRRNQKRA